MHTALMRRRRGGSAVARYAANSLRPEYVASFADQFFAVDGVPSTFAGAFEYEANGSPRLMTDSTGALKWSPHNLMPYSVITDANWTKQLTTITDAAAVAPDGTTTAAKIVENAGTGSKNVYLTVSATSGVTYTSSVFAKKGERDVLTFNGSSAIFGTQEFANVNLTTGTVQDKGSSASVSIEAFGDFYLVSVTVTATGSGSAAIAWGLSDGTTGRAPQYTGDGTSGLYLWGAHLYRSDLGGMADVPLDERVAGSTTYVPTTSAAKYLPRYPAYTYVSGVLTGPYLQLESSARTQLLHTTNALPTQSHTVTAVPHTLHFTGTGTVTLSGASTAGPLVGTGTGENNRVSLTFTPTAASLTLTVSGTVTNAQLEVGSKRSSYIPNLAGSGTVTRPAETLTAPYEKLPWGAAVSIGVKGLMTYADLGTSVTAEFYNWDALGNNVLRCRLDTDAGTGDVLFLNSFAGSFDFVEDTSAYTPGVNVPFNIASRNGSTFVNGAVDGTALTADTTPVALPDLSTTDMVIGRTFNGFIEHVYVWADDVGDAGIAETST